MNIPAEVLACRDELISLRRHFHTYPELGLQEYHTADFIETYLRELGLTPRRCTPTGVVADLHGGKPGKMLLLRCDIDALPVQEETGLPFASRNPGIMHACGHDAHIAIQLVTAKLLCARKEELCGSVRFVFQPNEEDAGAERMVKEGVLEGPKPDACGGYHIWSPIPTGKIGVTAGPLMASSYYFKLTIHGRGGHGGAPHTAINPIDAAGHVLEAIKTLCTLEFSALCPTVISVCKIHGGNKEIIVPDSVEMEGSLRCLHDGDEEVRARFAEVTEQVCRAYRCTREIEFVCGNTLLNNDKEMTDLLVRSAEQVVGRENILTSGISVMLGDDFAEFSRRVPGVYYFLGTADPEKHTDVEHHNARFQIDEESLPIGVAIQTAFAQEYLKG